MLESLLKFLPCFRIAATLHGNMQLDMRVEPIPSQRMLAKEEQLRKHRLWLQVPARYPK